MACSKCDNSLVVTNPCTPSEDCAGEACNCPVLLGSICVLYDGEELLVIDAVSGDDLTSILVKINDLLGTALDLNNLYVNIGTGAKVFKQVNTMNQAEIRTLLSSDGSITITENASDIDIVLNPTALGEDNTSSNLGTGTGLAAAKVGVNLPFKSLVSTTLDITSDANEVSVEIPNFDTLPRYIVNNAYAGSTELGSLSKPFKTIQGALDAFVGSGSADAPQFPNATIVIQKGSTYTFTGNLSYRNLNVIIEEDVVINHSPASGVYFVDYDSLTDLEATLSIEVKQGATLTLNQRGFRNIGSLGGAAEAKEIELTGNGTIHLGGVIASSYAMFTVNTGNTAGYAMASRQNFRVKDLTLTSFQKDFWNIGRDGELIFTNVTFRHSTVGAAINANSESFDQTGGIITLNSCELFINGITRNSGFTLFKDPSYGCTLELDRCRLTFPGLIVNMFVNKSNPDLPKLICRFFSTTNTASITEIFDSPVLWNANITFEYNSFFSGNIDPTVVDLTNGNTVSVSNLIAGENVHTLVTYADRVTAAASLSVGAIFINNNSGGASSTWFIDMVM